VFQNKDFFAKKQDRLGWVPPAVAPEGDLVFEEKAKSPLTLFKNFNIYTAT
jgi:hypothetical protein